MVDCVEVRVTAGTREEADQISSTVVERRLAACAQVVAPIVSTYWWRGEIHQANEWLLLMKTTADRFGELAGCVRALHSYEVPEIVAVPVAVGTADYLRWITRETSPEPGE
ncbi:divalent-cation tolerance protein CutA [Nonomuraea sp. NPDC050394]|uniref:divalent-cation tolerance protein CutA n=1 Tax=Nonomuraea sp. NPDC050394 TaxID=3364363 RepID=UPI00378875BD